MSVHLLLDLNLIMSCKDVQDDAALIAAGLLDANHAVTLAGEQLYWMTVVYFDRLLDLYQEGGNVPKTDQRMRAASRPLEIPQRREVAKKPRKVAGAKEDAPQMGLFR